MPTAGRGQWPASPSDRHQLNKEKHSLFRMKRLDGDVKRGHPDDRTGTVWREPERTMVSPRRDGSEGCASVGGPSKWSSSVRRE